LIFAFRYREGTARRGLHRQREKKEFMEKRNKKKKKTLDI